MTLKMVHGRKADLARMTYLSENTSWALNATRGIMAAAEAEYGMLDLVEVTELTGFGSDDVDALMMSGSLLTVRRCNQSRFPGFQFRDGVPAPTMEEMMLSARLNDWTNADLLFWLVVPRLDLDGRPAAELLHDEPGRVAAMAVRTMSRSLW